LSRFSYLLSVSAELDPSLDIDSSNNDGHAIAGFLCAKYGVD